MVFCLAPDEFIDPILPFEEIVVKVDGDKVCGSPSKAITRHWGDKMAKLHYHAKGIVDSSLFDDVYWDGVDNVLARSPEMFSVWVTKQVSGSCATNHMLARWPGSKVVDECPNCGCTPERSTHIHFCRDPGRLMVFHESVSKLLEWLTEQNTDPALTSLLSSYLRSRGTRSCSSLCTSSYYQPPCYDD